MIGFNQIWKNGSSPLVDTATNTYVSNIQQREAKEQQDIATMF